MSEIDLRSCVACGTPLKGRIDKRFCDDYCRNNYNNREKAKSGFGKLVRNINNALMKNRRVLDSILPENEDTSKATREKLLGLGFQFKYMTHTYTTRSGKTYNYCYDYGYLPLDNDWYLVVRKKEE